MRCFGLSRPLFSNATLIVRKSRLIANLKNHINANLDFKQPNSLDLRQFNRNAMSEFLLSVPFLYADINYFIPHHTSLGLSLNGENLHFTSRDGGISRFLMPFPARALALSPDESVCNIIARPLIVISVRVPVKMT